MVSRMPSPVGIGLFTKSANGKYDDSLHGALLPYVTILSVISAASG
jgi:hypothetical protein